MYTHTCTCTCINFRQSEFDSILITCGGLIAAWGGPAGEHDLAAVGVGDAFSICAMVSPPCAGCAGANANVPGFLLGAATSCVFSRSRKRCFQPDRAASRALSPWGGVTRSGEAGGAACAPAGFTNGAILASWGRPALPRNWAKHYGEKQ